MKEYGFDPIFILLSLVETYLAFIEYEDFLRSVVTDERSFKLVNFEKVIALKEDNKIKIEYMMYQKFLKLIEKLKAMKLENEANVVNYDDAPEEFFDPITTLLMDDPILLPSSKTIIDRSTILTHLLSDPTDPFNRSVLSREMLIECPELRHKIDEYRKSKTEKIN
jgi:ubiquitin conjugation factor E4 B